MEAGATERAAVPTDVEIFVAFYAADSAGAVAESVDEDFQLDEGLWEQVVGARVDARPPWGEGEGEGEAQGQGQGGKVQDPSPRGPLSPSRALGSPERRRSKRAWKGQAPRPAGYFRLRQARTGPAARLQSLLEQNGGSVPRVRDAALALLHRNLVARLHRSYRIQRGALRAWVSALRSAPHRVEARRRDTVDRFLARISEAQRGAAEGVCEAVWGDIVGQAFEQITAKTVAALAGPLPNLAAPLARTIPAADRGYAGPPRPVLRPSAGPRLRAGTTPRHAAAVARKKGALGTHTTEVISVGKGRVGPLPRESQSVLRVARSALPGGAAPGASEPSSELDEFIRAREAGVRRQLEESQRAAAAAHARRAAVKWRGWMPWKRLFLVVQRKHAVARRRHELSLARSTLAAWAGLVPELDAWRSAFRSVMESAVCAGLLRACVRTWASTARMAAAWRVLTARLLLQRWHRLCARKRKTLERLAPRALAPREKRAGVTASSAGDVSDDEVEVAALCRRAWQRRTLVHALRLWRATAEREWATRESNRRKSLLLSKASAVIAGLADL